MADERIGNGTVVRCVACGNWTMRARSDCHVEINCGNAKRCGVTLDVVVKDGQPTVKILSTKQA